MDSLTKFLFEGLPVRGMLVRLEGSWQELLARRGADAALPQAVQHMLGEMAAAAVLMQANIKFNGSLILQLQGDGPVRMAVAEAQPDLAFRATAKVQGAVDDVGHVGDAGAGPSLAALANRKGQGRLAITLDPKDRLPGQQPYQGVVPLFGDQREPLHRVHAVLEHYMLQSEQLDTKLVLAANGQVAAGLLIQRLPLQGAGNLAGARAGAAGLAALELDAPTNEDGIGRSEDYNRIAMLAATLTDEELLSLTPGAILHRLFWEETLRVFGPEQHPRPRFACTCSRERVRNMLRGLGREESESLIAERGQVEVGCEFCAQQYHFDAVDVGEMFTAAQDQPPTTGSMH